MRGHHEKVNLLPIRKEGPRCGLLQLVSSRAGGRGGFHSSSPPGHSVPAILRELSLKVGGAEREGQQLQPAWEPCMTHSIKIKPAPGPRCRDNQFYIQ